MAPKGLKIRLHFCYARFAIEAVFRDIVSISVSDLVDLIFTVTFELITFTITVNYQVFQHQANFRQKKRKKKFKEIL